MPAKPDQSGFVLDALSVLRRNVLCGVFVFRVLLNRPKSTFLPLVEFGQLLFGQFNVSLFRLPFIGLLSVQKAMK
jgi:hypothetical protein